jgi:hypothetical protein
MPTHNPQSRNVKSIDMAIGVVLVTIIVAVATFVSLFATPLIKTLYDATGVELRAALIIATAIIYHAHARRSK